ncbi:MAG: serine protease [Planctomycetes bacterium]|nr:serine protease [Planctomycetota bacterium]
MKMTRRCWLHSTLLFLLSSHFAFADGGRSTVLPSGGSWQIEQTATEVSSEAARVAQMTAVRITATRTVGMMQERSTGSGVIVASGGYVITAHHVVRGADTVELTMADRQRLGLRLVCVDTRHDLALLKVDSRRSFTAASLADCQCIRKGKSVLVAGAPEHDATLCLCPACIGERRTVVWDGRKAPLRSVRLTVHAGYSGGGCYDAATGKLLGIVVAKSIRYLGNGYFVPADRIAEMLNRGKTASQA